MIVSAPDPVILAVLDCTKPMPVLELALMLLLPLNVKSPCVRLTAALLIDCPAIVALVAPKLPEITTPEPALAVPRSITLPPALVMFGSALMLRPAVLMFVLLVIPVMLTTLPAFAEMFCAPAAKTTPDDAKPEPTMVVLPDTLSTPEPM